MDIYGALRGGLKMTSVSNQAIMLRLGHNLKFLWDCSAGGSAGVWVDQGACSAKRAASRLFTGKFE